MNVNNIHLHFRSSEYDMSDRSVEAKSDAVMIPDSSNDQYIKFTISSLEKDGGQTTIPFIDTQEVNSRIATPLSGFGIDHKGSNDFGGYIAPKLLTYDLRHHL